MISISISSNKLNYVMKNQIKGNHLYELTFYNLKIHTEEINNTILFTPSIPLLATLQTQKSKLREHSLYKLRIGGYALFKGFFCPLFKNNGALINTHPYLSSILNGSSSTSGFKKQLYNRVAIQNHRLSPSYSRRKHKHSYSIIVTNQLRKLSKAFQYLGKNKLSNYITFALSFSNMRTNSRTIISGIQPKLPINQKAIPTLVSILEIQKGVLLWRNLFKHSLAYSQQMLRHKNSNTPLERNTVLRLTQNRYAHLSQTSH